MKTTKIETTRNTKKTKKTIRRRRGQGMTEYIVIVGLIAILLIPAVRLLKNTLSASFNKASEKIDKDITQPMDKIDGGAGGSGGGAQPGGSGT
jgi:Flp pilus assembly pilin Flp